MKLLKYIFSTATLALALVSCSSDEPMPEDTMGASDSCELVVTLNTGVQNPSKAPITNNPWEDGYPEEEGTNWENTVETLHLYFIPEGQDGSNAIYLVPVSSAGDNGKYEYRVRISVSESFVAKKEDGDYSISGRIVAIANYQNPAPANPLNFRAFDIDKVNEDHLIPMWGVTTVTDLTMRINHTSYAGNIQLLRAVPKITFMLDEQIASEYTISNVQPVQTNYLNLAYAYPGEASTALTTESLKTEDCFNPVLASNDYSTPYFWGLNTTKAWCYVSERTTTGPRGGYSFKVTLRRNSSNQPPITGTVYLCDYVDKKPDVSAVIPQLVRNHDYQYIISLSELKFIISFREWVFGGNVHLELE
ncbi:MAG: hypothetical protein NC217_02130 [Muribaculaceae bacterium]|nr:hypothetical protein [Muribaculaceae bacterium]